MIVSGREVSNLEDRRRQVSCLNNPLERVVRIAAFVTVRPPHGVTGMIADRVLQLVGLYGYKDFRTVCGTELQ